MFENVIILPLCFTGYLNIELYIVLPKKSGVMAALFSKEIYYVVQGFLVFSDFLILDALHVTYFSSLKCFRNLSVF